MVPPNTYRRDSGADNMYMVHSCINVTDVLVQYYDNHFDFWNDSKPSNHIALIQYQGLYVSLTFFSLCSFSLSVLSSNIGHGNWPTRRNHFGDVNEDVWELKHLAYWKSLFFSRTSILHFFPQSEMRTKIQCVTVAIINTQILN